MSYLLFVTKLINIVAILLFAVGLFFVCDKEISTKHKATLGTAMALVMGLYIFLLGFVAVGSIWQEQFIALILILFIIIPFILGHFSKFETVKLFTIFQIVSFVCSLIVLYLV